MDILPDRPTPQEFRAFVRSAADESDDPRQPIVVTDRDGTIASVAWVRPVEGDAISWHRFNAGMSFDAVVPYVESLLRAVPEDIPIFMFSGRMAGNRKGEDFRYWQMLDWIRKHDLPIAALLMRKGGDQRRDSLIKNEFYDLVSDQYRIVAAIDDRDQVCDEVWRARGVPLVQVVDPHLLPLLFGR